MSWPKGKPNPWASERMKRWHQEQRQGREVKPKKRSRSLHFLSEPERKIYDKLRKNGISRHDALVEVMSDAL